MAKMHSDRDSARAILLAALLGIGIATVVFFGTIRSAERLLVQLEVSPVAGISLGENKLAFGSVPPGGNGVRQLLLENKGNTTALMRLFPSGEVVPWLELDAQWVLLKAGERRQLSAHMWVPDDAVAGNYTGSVEIVTHSLR